MRIGIVCPYDWDAPGGVQVHVRDQALALMELGHDVRVLAPAADDVPRPSWFTSGGPARAVAYNGSVARLAFGIGATRRVREWIRAGEFDVLHVHEPLAPSLSALAVWASTGPIVGTFHSSMERSRVLAAGQALAHTVLEKVRGRIAVSERAREMLVSHLGGDAVVIPNGVRVSDYRGKQPLAGHPREHSLLFLGRMNEPRKGLDILFAALPAIAARHPDVSVLVAGPGDIAEALTGLDPQHHGRVEFLGRVDDEVKASVLHSATLYVAPNTGGESFGIILTEAMSSGIAVVASDLDAFTDVLADGTCGAQFRNGDPADLARVVCALFADPEWRADLVRRATAHVEQFDWNRVARQLVDVYASVLAADIGVREDLRGQLVGRLARLWEGQ